MPNPAKSAFSEEIESLLRERKNFLNQAIPLTSIPGLVRWLFQKREASFENGMAGRRPDTWIDLG
jgi:hypothetical protein